MLETLDVIIVARRIPAQRVGVELLRHFYGEGDDRAVEWRRVEHVDGGQESGEQYVGQNAGYLRIRARIGGVEHVGESGHQAMSERVLAVHFSYSVGKKTIMNIDLYILVLVE